MTTKRRLARVLLSALLLIPLCGCAAVRGFFEGTETQPSQAATVSSILRTVLPGPIGEAGGLLITALGLIVTSTKKKETK